MIVQRQVESNVRRDTYDETSRDSTHRERLARGGKRDLHRIIIMHAQFVGAYRDQRVMWRGNVQTP